MESFVFQFLIPVDFASLHISDLGLGNLRDSEQVVTGFELRPSHVGLLERHKMERFHHLIGFGSRGRSCFVPSSNQSVVLLNIDEKDATFPRHSPAYWKIHKSPEKQACRIL